MYFIVYDTIIADIPLDVIIPIKKDIQNKYNINTLGMLPNMC